MSAADSRGSRGSGSVPTSSLATREDGFVWYGGPRGQWRSPEGIERHRARCLAAIHRRYDARRAQVAAERERRGGACEAPGCGETEGLQWHHREPAAKAFGISRAHKHTEAAVAEELAKCTLLCASCHRAEHARMRFSPIQDASRRPYGAR